MSNDDRTRETKIETILIPKRFHLRRWDSWGAPSLIFLLGGQDQRTLREAFDIHWPDLDIHVKMIEQVCATGLVREQSIRKAQNVKVVYELNKVPQGIEIKLHVASMTDRNGKPYFVDKGEGGGEYLRMRSFERLFPAEMIETFFNKANAGQVGMNAYLLKLQAAEKGDAKISGEIDRALDMAHDGLNGPGSDVLTVKVEDAVRTSEGRKKGGNKKPAKEKLSDVESADEAADATARALTVALTGVDPGAGLPTDDEGKTPEPVASASPTPAKADKPKQEKKPRPPKMGLQDLGSLKEKLSVGTSDGSNGQS